MRWIRLVAMRFKISFWVTDPDGNEWEFFYTKAHSDVHQIEESSCCTTSNEVAKNSCC